MLVVLNYALLIPFGYGNHMPGWLGMGQHAGMFILGTVTRLTDEWCRGLR